MNIIATIKNSLQQNDVIVETDGNKKKIIIPAKSNGQGSSVNGAELLFLSLATVFAMIYTGRRPEEILLSNPGNNRLRVSQLLLSATKRIYNRTPHQMRIRRNHSLLLSINKIE